LRHSLQYCLWHIRHSVTEVSCSNSSPQAAQANSSCATALFCMSNPSLIPLPEVRAEGSRRSLVPGTASLPFAKEKSGERSSNSEDRRPPPCFHGAAFESNGMQTPVKMTAPTHFPRLSHPENCRGRCGIGSSAAGHRVSDPLDGRWRSMRRCSRSAPRAALIILGCGSESTRDVPKACVRGGRWRHPHGVVVSGRVSAGWREHMATRRIRRSAEKPGAPEDVTNAENK
jgi:hypothetical protein